MNTDHGLSPCVGRSPLFDSIDWADHHRARDLCATCPVLTECFIDCRAAIAAPGRDKYAPTGTWAGELLTPDRVERMRRALRAAVKVA